MWRPPVFTKHELPAANWPTVEEAGRARLFQPIRIGPVTLQQRTWVPAMVPWRATEDGYVTHDVLDWYERLAEGEPGAIVVEATGIRDIPSGPLLRIGHDRFIPGLTKLVERVERASSGRTRLFIQIIDFLTIRRRPSQERYVRQYLRITERHRAKLGGADNDIRERLLGMSNDELTRVLSEREHEALQFGYRERITDLDLDHIRDLPRSLPEAFAEAAARAERAGFHGVELHYAHAYTMASFLSALNDRPDAYGGPRENRVRLPVEVCAAVKSAVSSNFAVGCRYLTADCIAGGSTLEDSIYFGLRFAQAGMDFLSLSRGGKFEDAKQPRVGWAAYPYTGRSGYECMPTIRSDHVGPFGRNIQATGSIRSAICDRGYTTPVVVAGGICTFDQAERILADGNADVVAAARQSLADPDWFLKMRTGKGDEIRRCVYTNYCEGLDQAHKHVTCKLWDREHRDDANTPLSPDGKRRLVAPHWNEHPTRDGTAP